MKNIVSLFYYENLSITSSLLVEIDLGQYEGCKPSISLNYKIPCDDGHFYLTTKISEKQGSNFIDYDRSERLCGEYKSGRPFVLNEGKSYISFNI